MRKLIYILPLIAFSCTTGISLVSVDYGSLFNDSNSKVWLVNKHVVDNANITPIKLYDKEIMIFHNNGVVDCIALKDITRKKTRKGQYVLDSENRTMKIEFKNDQIWDLDLSYITEDSILMEPTKSSDINITVQLKPLPEF
jgi:hypothetical protein